LRPGVAADYASHPSRALLAAGIDVALGSPKEYEQGEREEGSRRDGGVFIYFRPPLSLPSSLFFS
jgi:hypothetical protein